MDEREEVVQEEKEEEEGEEEEEEDWDEDYSSVASSDDSGEDQSDDAQQRARIGDDLLWLHWEFDVPAQRQRSDPADESFSYRRRLPWIVTFNNGLLETAASVLTLGAADIGELTVSMNIPRRQWDEEDVTNYPRIFGDFVDLLAGPTRVIRAVRLDGMGFHTNHGIRPDDLEKLFGATLPSHPTLERIHLRGCAISNEYFALLTSSVRSRHETPLVELVFTGSFVDRDRAQIFADLVRRNSQLRSLTLSAVSHGLSPDDFRLISEGLSCNTNLQRLTVDLAEVHPDTLDFAVAASSPLCYLAVTGYLSSDTVNRLATHLRTNVTLVELTISQRFPRSHCNAAHFDPIADALETYNFTLLRLDHIGDAINTSRHAIPGGDEGRIGRCLRRNRRICRALRQLSNYHVASTVLWPTVFEMASPLPALLYRFLRSGNVQALCDVAAAQRISNEKN